MRGAEETTAAFMLMQPLEDYKPLVLAGGDSPMEDIDATATAAPQQHRGLGTVLLSDRQQPLVLSHDTTRQAHTLWAVRGDAEWQASACWEQESGSGGAAASSFLLAGEGGGVALFLLQAERQSLAIHHLAPAANGGGLSAVAPTVTIAAVAAQPVAATLPTHGHAYAALEAAGVMQLAVVQPDGRLALWLCTRAGARCVHTCAATPLRAPPSVASAGGGAVAAPKRLGCWRPAGQTVADCFRLVAPVAGGAEEVLELQLHRWPSEPLLALCLRAVGRALPELQLLDLLAFLLADGADRGAGVEPEPEP